MKAVLISLFLASTFLFPVQNAGMRPSQAVGQPPQQRTPAQRESVHELNLTALSYRDGNFAEAQEHAEKALALDPLSKVAPKFLARTIHAQYKPGDRDEANIAKAREAIDAYKLVLAQDPQFDEAYKAVAYFYSALKEDAFLREWVFRRAVDPAFSVDKRAEAFILLASKDWDCSFKITELPTSKIVTVLKGRALKVDYTKPKDVAEFERARQCAAHGLDMIDTAITLTPDNETAWSYKTNLLLELSKLAEMDNDPVLKTDYKRQVEAARSTLEGLNAGSAPK